MATISGVLLYTCVQQPTFKYQDKVNKEFKVSVCVSEDDADDWNDKFPKQAAKVVKTSDFEAEYKIAAPFPDERKQYVITLKRDAQYADGNPLPEKYKPKVFMKNDKGLLVDVTQEKLVGNGSIGVVSYEVRSNDYGDFAKLKNVRVDDLVEYVSRSAGDDELGEFADATDDFDDADTTTAAKSNAKSDDKPSGKAGGKSTNRPARGRSTSVADLDDDIPF